MYIMNGKVLECSVTIDLTMIGEEINKNRKAALKRNLYFDTYDKMELTEINLYQFFYDEDYFRDKFTGNTMYKLTLYVTRIEGIGLKPHEKH